MTPQPLIPFTDRWPDTDQMRADAALGAAWRQCEAALPEGWVMWTLGPNGFTSSARDWGIERRIHSWEALALGPTDRAVGSGPTPTAALKALAARLEAKP